MRTSNRIKHKFPLNSQEQPPPRPLLGDNAWIIQKINEGMDWSDLMKGHSCAPKWKPNRHFVHLKYIWKRRLKVVYPNNKRANFSASELRTHPSFDLWLRFPPLFLFSINVEKIDCVVLQPSTYGKRGIDPAPVIYVCMSSSARVAEWHIFHLQATWASSQDVVNGDKGVLLNLL